MTLENFEQEIDATLFRLGQELLKLKAQGIVSKHRRITRVKVKRLAVIIGVEKLRTLSYQEFEALCKQYKI